MILGFKEKFADGTLTEFEKKILAGTKIHSLRKGDRWRAGMSIQMAHGVRTKKYRVFNNNMERLQVCTGVQDIFMTYNGWALEITIDGYYNSNASEINALIQNDGVNRQRFLNWFLPKGKDEWSGQIIHWTNFKY